jgi:hypothetical protein
LNYFFKIILKLMKKIYLIIPIILISIYLHSCSDSGIDSLNHGPTNFADGYSNDESGVCMTLASLAYVNENNSAYIKDSLIVQLSNQNYATGGAWKLAWGPALSSDKANMMYVVKDTVQNPDMYAIAIRGTDWCFLTNIEQDILVYDLVPYTYSGNINDSISQGSSSGLTTLLSLRDPVTHKTFVEYLNVLQRPQPGTKHDLFITGHSLGGALATVLTSWFLDKGYGSLFNIKSYTFAAPMVGNAGYVQHFNNIISASNSESHRVINPNDIIPRFVGDIDSILLQQIPIKLPLSIETALIAIYAYFTSEGILYYHVGQAQYLGTKQTTGCSSGSYFDQYECWVGFEHDHNTYLTLLGAPETNFYYAPCEVSVPPSVNLNPHRKK